MFSGVGGFELGISAAYGDRPARQNQETDTLDKDSTDTPQGNPRQSATCIGYSEIDKYAIKVYERQFNGHRNYGDATTINPADLPDFELLVGGFPCQSFSIAGKRKGFDDTRGTLFFDIARILKDKRPGHLLLENVKGLLSHDGGKTFQTMLGVLSDLGYRVEWQVLNSKDFGVPQNRERIFIVGHLRDGCGRQVFPIRGTSVKDVQSGSEESGRRSWVSTLDSRYGERWSTETYVRPSKRQTGRQVKTKSDHNNTDRGASHSQVRRLTPKECERLQGFPDDWTAGESDTQRYKMMGNAVTTNTVQAVMSKLKDCLAPQESR